MDTKNNGGVKVLTWLILILFITVIVATNKVAMASKNTAYKIKIVLDAGHGGIDGGCEGSLPESVESKLNLLITNCSVLLSKNLLVRSNLWLYHQ